MTNRLGSLVFLVVRAGLIVIVVAAAWGLVVRIIDCSVGSGGSS